VKPRISHPNLEEAPILPNSPKPPRVLSLPQQAPVISPPVQTGVFASNLPPKASPQLPVASGQSAGFDVAVTRGAQVPEVYQAGAAGFDTASPNSRPALAGATVQTGAFGQASGGQPGAARLPGAKVGGTGFDTRPATVPPPLSEQAIRKSGFDELKPVNLPVKAAAPAVSAVHPVEILEKPKPAYTDEARQRKIEGDVVLDVIFTAACEVRVLRVVQGLGYGLDENAVSAARHIRFTPASQSGSPIDQRVTIRVVFQITQ
jgi:TonB family protein